MAVATQAAPAASPAAAPAAAAAPATTLATSEPAASAAAPAAGDGAVAATPAAGTTAAPAGAADVAVADQRAWLSKNVEDPTNKLAGKTDDEIKQLYAKAKEVEAAESEKTRRAALTPEARKAEDDAKAEAEAKVKADQVPEKYDLKAPDGMTLDAEVSGEFEAAAKEMGLSQGKAQKLFDIGVKSVQKNTNALLTDVKALQDGWLTASKADAEFGGDKLDANMAIAKSAMKFATPELKKILNESRLGDHPEMIRWMYRVGKAMAEDTFTQGSRTTPAVGDRHEQIAKKLYPNAN